MSSISQDVKPNNKSPALSLMGGVVVAVAAIVLENVADLKGGRAWILSYLLTSPLWYLCSTRPRFAFRIFLFRVISYGVVLLIGYSTLQRLFTRWTAPALAQGLAVFFIGASFYLAPPLTPQTRKIKPWLWLLCCLALGIFVWLTG